MICLEVVDLLSEGHCPQILTQKLYHVQLVSEPGPVAGEAFGEPEADAEAETVEAEVDSFAVDFGLGFADGAGRGLCGCSGGCLEGRDVVYGFFVALGETFGQRDELDQEEVEAGRVQQRIGREGARGFGGHDV